MNLNVSGVPESEYSEEFIQKMLNRMGVSYYKYGRIQDAYPHNLSAIKSLKQRLERYLEDGNLEWLVDLANFAMIEFMRPSHVEAHYSPQDSDTSPGRTTNSGYVTKGNNHDRSTWI